MTCKHCGETRRREACEICGKTLHDACRECHDEIDHGVVPAGSVHVAGNDHTGLTPRQRQGLKHTGS